jgi:CheY-like chemotaxis protein
MDPKIKKIYLAEDDADDRIFFEDALKQITTPTHLTIANDGLELMNSLEDVEEPPPPHVIFLDLNMPRKNGFECLQEIRDAPKLKHIPVIIFSTTDNEDTVDITYQYGATYYICKPHSFELLVKAIERVLSLEMWMVPQPSKEKFRLVIA